MFHWEWLDELKPGETACFLTYEHERRFSAPAYDRHAPQKLLKPVLMEAISENGIHNFIIPLLSKFQIAAGSVLNALRLQYPQIKLIVIKIPDFDVGLYGSYLALARKLLQDADICTDALPDSHLSAGKLKRALVRFLASFNYMVITDKLDLRNGDTLWRIYEKNLEIQNHKRDILSLCHIAIKKLTAIKENEKNIIDLQKKIKPPHVPKPDREYEMMINLHNGLYHERVIWPVGFCHLHKCGLEYKDMASRRCLFRSRRYKKCKHFQWVFDEPQF